MTEFKILDFMCGQGKSTFVRNMVAENPDKKYLYVAPYLSECHIFAGTKYDPKDSRKKPIYKDGSKYDYKYNESPVYGADLRFMNFRHPNTRNKLGSKEESLCRMIERGNNIVSTHALFTDLGSNALDCAKEYTLIIDETVNVYELDNIKKDVDHCLQSGFMSISKEDNMTLIFNRLKYAGRLEREDGKDPMVDSRYEDLAYQCDLGQLLYIDGKAVVWELSPKLLKAFKEVWVCTYMFEGSDMCSFFKKHDIDYSYVKIEGKKKSRDVAHLIEVIDDPKLNLIGEVVSLSSTVSKHGSTGKNGTKKLSQEAINTILKNNLHNIFNQKWKAKANDRLWTSYKNQSKVIASGKYGNQFLAYNYKATNEHINKHHVAFLLNVFQNPMIQQVCNSRNVETSNEHFAISTLIQFIFRSAVRKGEPIKLYLPSLRMRELLERWKQGEFDE